MIIVFEEDLTTTSVDEAQYDVRFKGYDASPIFIHNSEYRITTALKNNVSSPTPNVKSTTQMFQLLLILLLLTQNTAEQRHCNGICIHIKQCAPLFNILKQPRPIPQKYMKILVDAQCGFEGSDPKVCCPILATTETPRPTTQPTTTPAPSDVSRHPNLKFLQHDLCGPISQAKIFEGNKTTVFEFPWMALIAYDVGKSNPEFRCGGSLINQRYVLTAAHCLYALPSGLRLSGVRLGEHDLGKERDCDVYGDGMAINCAERYQDFGVERVQTHPGYSRGRLENDIGLIRIDRDADLRRENVRPICLPVGTAALLGETKVTVTGWGSTEFGVRSQDLLKVRLPLVSNERCAEAYKDQHVRIWYKQLCAGGSNRMDSCSGDSGGPLQALGTYYGQPRNIVYGVVSFGPKNCGIEGFPGVYTRISYYVEWILNAIRE